jgi:hypothetical protein
LFVLIAVSHALNNEATVAMDLPVLPIASQAVDIAAQSRGNLSFLFGHGNSGQIMSFIERK